MMSTDLPVKEITPLELQDLLTQGSAPIILDVREVEELNICRLSTYEHIPLGDLLEEFERLPIDQPIVVLCHHGRRSYQASLFLKSHGFAHVLNLKGGIHAWAEQVDPKMARY